MGYWMYGEQSCTHAECSGSLARGKSPGETPGQPDSLGMRLTPGYWNFFTAAFLW